MAGKPGRSGPPSNMNNLKRGWDVYWKRRALRPQDKWVALEAARYRDGLLSDHPNPTAAERRAIELASEAKACRLLIWSAIKQSGFTEHSKEGLRLIPAAESLPKFIGVELGALRLLGLERKAKQVEDIALTIQQDLQAPDGGSHES